MTHCFLHLFVFIYSLPSALRRAGRRELQRPAWQRGVGNGVGIVSFTLLAKGKSAERSSWHRNCVAQAFKVVQVSA